MQQSLVGQARGVLAWTRTVEGTRLVRYSMVSVVAVICSQAILGITLGLFHWSARASNVTAVALSTIPSYTLNRAWVWGKRGRSHVSREIVPFWAMAFLGLLFSTWAADFADTHAFHLTSSHAVHTMIVMAASLGAFGVLWIGKFVLLNKVLFAPTREPEEFPAVEGV